MEPLRTDPPGSATKRAQRVWLLKGPKLGDYAQMRALATALGFAFETKTLAFRRTELLLHALDRPTLAGLVLRESDVLLPPWPDLVITAGRRNELVARWVKAQSRGTTRVVHIGRPWSSPEEFDLVIATPQYTLPRTPTVLVNELPLHEVTPSVLADAARQWETVLGGFRHPRLAVLVGGNSGPYVFDTPLAGRLADAVNESARQAGARVWLSTSPRTPRAFARALLAKLDPPAHAYVWSASSAHANPYRGYLALADALVVTSESVSMLTEALATGKPVYVFDVADRRPHKWLRPSSYRWKPFTHALAQRFAPQRFRRDVGELHRQLIANGRTAWLGSQMHPISGASTATGSDIARTVAAVKHLLR